MNSRNELCLPGIAAIAAIAVPEFLRPGLGVRPSYSWPEVSVSQLLRAALHDSRAGPILRLGIRSETAQICAATWPHGVSALPQ